MRRGVEYLLRRAPRARLQVLHGVERGLVPAAARTADAVLHDPDVVVTLVCVGEGVVHTHVGETADDHEGRDPQAPQYEVELGADEARVTALDDVDLAALWPQRGPKLRRLLALDAVDTLGAVEFAAEVDAAAAVDLLEEDHWDGGHPRRRHEPLRLVHPLLPAAHVSDAGHLLGEGGATLDIYDDQCRIADEEGLHGHGDLTFRH